MTQYRDRFEFTGSFGAVVLGIAMLGSLVALPASAVTIGFDPPSHRVGLGDAVAVDVVFTNLGDDVISAYDLDVTYDSSILDATDVIFTPALGDELFFEAFDAFDLSTDGVVDLAQLSLLPDIFLDLLQPGDSVYVATLVFDAIGSGTTELGFLFDDFNDVKGHDAAILPVLTTVGSIAVEEAQAPVPEPSAAILFTVGSVLVGSRLRSR